MGAVPCDLASSHRTEGVFMACCTRTKAAVTAPIGARIDVEYAGVGEVLQVLSTGLQLFGIGNNFKPIVIGAVIVLAVVLDAYRDRLLRSLEGR
jgi:hypothetical protein